MRRSQALALACQLSVLLFAGEAAADPAEEFFERGVASMEQGRFEEACPKIESSYRLDPRPGTLFTLAECEAKRGRIATAVARYNDYLKMYASLPLEKQERQGTRERESRAAIAKLEPHVPRLLLDMPRGAPPGTVVKLDGAVVNGSSLGVAHATDPGGHLVTTLVPGGPVRVEHITMARGEQKRVPLKLLMALGHMSAEDRARGQELFQKGTEYYKSERWVEAEEAFDGAWAMGKTYDIAAHLGHTEYHLGKMREAAEHLGFALRNWPLSGKPEPKELARTRYEEVRAKVGGIAIKVSVAGAEVAIDGQAIGTSPLAAEVMVEPGAHRVEAKLKGYKLASSAVRAMAGGTHAVKLDLVREEVVTPGGGGDRPAWATPVIIGGALGSAVGAGLGIGFTLAAYGEQDDAAMLLRELQEITLIGTPVCPETVSRTPRCEEVQSRLVTSDRYVNIAIGSFVAGGVLAVGTVGVAIWTSTRPAKPSTSYVRFAPVVSATHTGLSAAGTW
jgi:tetratricopeptide (TPR) repeat protein